MTVQGILLEDRKMSLTKKAKFCFIKSKKGLEIQFSW